MNRKLLNEHIKAFNKSIVPMVMAADGSNAVDFYCADVVAGKKFAQNFGGYPRSEIAEINAQTNEAVQLAMLKSLEDYSSAANNQNAGKTDAEIALSHKSRYQQTATEMQDWLQNQLAIRDAKRAAALHEAAAAAAAKKAASQPKTKTTTVPAEPE